MHLVSSAAVCSGAALALGRCVGVLLTRPLSWKHVGSLEEMKSHEVPGVASHPVG